MKPTGDISKRGHWAGEIATHPLSRTGVLRVTDADTGEEHDAIGALDIDGKVAVLGIIPPEGKKFYARVPLDKTQDAETIGATGEVTLDDTPTPVGEIPMDNYRAAMIAEGVEEVSDEETYFAAWQHLEDTGLGYQLQGWFGRRLQDLIAEGRVVPRTAPLEAPPTDA